MWLSFPSAKILLGASLVAVSAVVVYRLTSRKKKMTRIIEMMEEFQKSNVHIRDSDRVEKLVTQLIKDGKDKLQVVSDFDKTISKHSVNGKRVPSCHGVLDQSEFLPESYRTEALKLRDTYYPIEMSTSVSLEEKEKAMIKWWTTAHGLLVNCDLTESKIAQIVAKSEITLRDGVNQTFELLHQNNIPLLIFSAGVGDILKEAIKQRELLFDNIFVISNFMDFDTEGKLIGFKGELIHTFNKHEVAVHHPEIFEKNKMRKNVILLGDTLGDLTMADGMPYKENILTIGFLNDHISENLEEYKKKYDVVLVDESSFDLAQTVLQKII